VGAAAASPAARPHRLAGRCPQTRPGGDQNLTTPTTSRPPSPRRRARRGEGERLRADILEAATRLLFGAGDESAVSIRAVADAVGVTPPSIYLHFSDKNELIMEVCREQFRKLDEHLRAATAGVEDPIEAMHACGRAYVDFGLSNAEGYRVLFMGRWDHGHKGELAEPGEIELSAFVHLVQNVERGMRQGRIAPADPKLVALGLWATAHGITSLLISHPGFPWPPDASAMVDCVLAQGLEGVMARGPGASPLHGAHGEALDEAVEEEVVDQRDGHGDDHRRRHQ
jgi:AcrR family transcriptional regulator